MEEKEIQKKNRPNNKPQDGQKPPQPQPTPRPPQVEDDDNDVASAEDIAAYAREVAERRAKKTTVNNIDNDESPLSREYDEALSNQIDPYLEPDPTIPSVPYKESLFLARGCSKRPEAYVPVKEHEMRSCCKVGASNWMKGIHRPCECMFDIVEVRFKNNRKEFYRLPDGIDVNEGDLVAVEGVPGHDVGIVSLIGEACRLQMIKKKVSPDNENIKKLFRRAKSSDIERWVEALHEERNALVKTRQITEELGLVMKVNDVEFQGDRSKAIFYYTADDRVDFRNPIKVLADEFKVRVEMKQIGVRQEAGKVGGIGTCGRELCCSTWLTNFKSVTTGVAKAQQILPNPQKLAGQCGKLKCCLNFEYEVYVDALKSFPPANTPIRFQKGLALYRKTDVLRGIMWYCYEGDSELYAIKAENVKKIIEMNRNQQYPEKLEDYQEELMSTAALVQETSATEFEQELLRMADNGNEIVTDDKSSNRDRQNNRGNRQDKNNRGDRKDHNRNNEGRNENKERQDRPRNNDNRGSKGGSQERHQRQERNQNNENRERNNERPERNERRNNRNERRR